jgi:hypothetical protein
MLIGRPTFLSDFPGRPLDRFAGEGLDAAAAVVRSLATCTPNGAAFVSTPKHPVR